MKPVLPAILAVLLLKTAAIAQGVTVIESAEIIDYGIYRIELTGQHVPMPSAGAGAVQPALRAVLVAQTNQISAILGTTFGLHFMLIGKPAGAAAKVDIIVEHPAFKKPDGKTTGTSDKVPWSYRIGEKVGYTYTFDHDWEAVPGTWKIEVWRDGKKLAGKDFLVKAERK